VKEYTLENGLKVLLLPSQRNELVAVDVLVNVGLATEKGYPAGITNFVQRLLLKGTKNRDAYKIALDIEEVGGEIETSMGEDYAEVYVVLLCDKMERGLEVLSDVIFNPTFPTQEVEKERKMIISSIRQAEDDKFEATKMLFVSTLYGEHPYAYPILGYEDTVKEIKREDLVNYHTRFYHPNNMVLAAVGKFDEEKMLALIKKYFGDKRKGEIFEPKYPPLASLSKDVEVYKEKDVEQAFIILGYPGVSVSSPDYPALKVLNAMLGAGMSSRLFRNLRDKEGLAYAIGSFFPTRRDIGEFAIYMGTKYENVEKAKEGILAEIRRIREEGISTEELERAKNYIEGTFKIAHQRNRRQAWYLAWYEMLGVGWEFDRKYLELIRGVTAEDVKRAAEKYLKHYVMALLKPEGEG